MDMRLKLDFDSDVKSYKFESEMCAKLKRAGYKAAHFSWKRSPSNQGWHCIVKLDPEPSSPLEVVALQAILGSDSFREASNLFRAKQLPFVGQYWQKRWNVLYCRSEKRQLRQSEKSIAAARKEE